jgi:hypothetical protein
MVKAPILQNERKSEKRLARSPWGDPHLRESVFPVFVSADGPVCFSMLFIRWAKVQIKKLPVLKKMYIAPIFHFVQKWSINKCNYLI